MFTAASKVYQTGLGAVKTTAALMASGMFKDNLIDYTKVSRVEPLVLIDADVMYYDNITEVSQSMLSIFAAYYLQAVALSMTIANINVTQHLDKLNPSRDVADSFAWHFSQEAYEDRLFVPYNIATESKEEEELAKRRMTHDEEKLKLDKEKQEHIKSKDAASSEIEKQKLIDSRGGTDFGIGRDTLATLKEITNLSVGKVFSVEITDGLHKATIPISIRLLANMLPTTSLIHILSINGQDKLDSFKERWHGWKSGRLEFWKDLIGCQDLIDAHRRNLVNDKEGVYTNIVNRNKNNQLAGAVTKTPSLANASNLVITSSDTISKLEMHLEGKFSDFKIREKLFKETYLMIVAVIDKGWDRVTFYHRGIHLPTEVSIRDLKDANKGSGPNVSDLLKAYSMGNSPSL